MPALSMTILALDQRPVLKAEAKNTGRKGERLTDLQKPMMYLFFSMKPMEAYTGSTGSGVQV